MTTTLLYISFTLIAGCVFIRFYKSYKRKQLFNLAYRLTLNGHTINAIKVYTRLIELSPKNFVYYNNRGHCYLVLEEIEHARADFEKSIELEPDLLDNHITYENIKRLESLIKLNTIDLETSNNH